MSQCELFQSSKPWLYHSLVFSSKNKPQKSWIACARKSHMAYIDENRSLLFNFKMCLFKGMPSWCGRDLSKWQRYLYSKSVSLRKNWYFYFMGVCFRGRKMWYWLTPFSSGLFGDILILFIDKINSFSLTSASTWRNSDHYVSFVLRRFVTCTTVSESNGLSPKKTQDETTAEENTEKNLEPLRRGWIHGCTPRKLAGGYAATSSSL